MRIAVMALAVVACVACKDKQPAKQAPSPASEREGQPKAKPPSLETATVTGPGLVPATGLGPKITLTKTELKLEGQTISAVSGDTLDPGALAALTRQLESKATSDAPVAITFDATLPYRRVGQLLDALRRAGFRNIALLAGSGSQMIPIELPDTEEINGPGLRLVISLDRTQLRLWSASGQEGTKRKPKLSMAVSDTTSFAPVTRALTEIVQRRWPDGNRPAQDRSIIVQLDGNQSVQAMLGLLAAVRADGSLELFPEIFLAGGL
jgi:hypothetical protein